MRMVGRPAAIITTAVLAVLCLGVVQRGSGHAPVSELSALVGHYHGRDAFRPSTAPAVKLIVEMDAQRRREELKRLFAPRRQVVSYPGPGIDPFWWNFWWMYGQENTRPVFARDIRDFGWDRTLERVPGVVVR